MLYNRRRKKASKRHNIIFRFSACWEVSVCLVRCVHRRGFTGTCRFQSCANATAPLSSSHQHASCSTIKKEEQQAKRGDFSAEAAWTDAVEAEAPKRCGNNEALHPSLLSIEIEEDDCRVPVVIINYSALLCVWGASSDRVSTCSCWRQVKAICVSDNYNRQGNPLLPN